MKNVLFILAASLFIGTAVTAQTTTTDKKADKKELRQDLKSEKTDRRQRRQDVKAARYQTKKAHVAGKVSTVAENHGKENIAVKADEVAGRSDARADARKTDAVKQTKEIRSDNKEVRKDEASLRKDGVKRPYRKTVRRVKKH